MKRLISLVIRYVPRKYLQRVSGVALRTLSVFYSGNDVECPVCKSTFRKFLPYGRVPRPNVLCPSCQSLERHRLIWLYLQQRTDFFTAPQKVLHVAPEDCFIHRFEQLPNLDYITADIESPLAKVKMDIHDIPFEADTFDTAFCNHVMEHVEDDIRAMSELCRVLKPGAWAIIQIPLFHPLKENTHQDPSITDPKEREKIFGQSDHVRMYGKDYADRLRQGGFEVTEDWFVKELPANQAERYRLPMKEPIFFCRKPIA
ncbi:MAG: methyltransferase domain-containing protein [Cyclobacteriaceae bacterium]